MNGESVVTPFAELEPLDRTILTELQGSRSTPADIGANITLMPQYVEWRLKLLEADGYVESDDRGVYGIVNDPREEAGR